MKHQFPFLVLKSNRNLRNLWIGESISHFGFHLYQIAIMWFIFVMTDSGLQIGLFLVSALLPKVILRGFFETKISRHGNLRRTMRVTSITQSFLSFVLATLILLHLATMVGICIITILASIVQLAYFTAREGMFPNLLPEDQLVRGNIFFDITELFTRLGGWLAGGLLITFANTSIAVTLDALASIALALFIRCIADVPSVGTDKQKPLSLRDMHGTWRWLWSKKELLMLIVLYIVSFIAVVPTNTLTPQLIQRVMHVNAIVLGEFEACIVLGFLVGLGIRTLGAQKLSLPLTWGWFLRGVAMAVMANAPNIFVAGIGNFLLGLLGVSTHFTSYKLFSTLVPKEMKTRVESIVGVALRIALLISYCGVGFLGDVFGVQWSYKFGAYLFVCCALIGIMLFKFRKMPSGNLIYDESL